MGVLVIKLGVLSVAWQCNMLCNLAELPCLQGSSFELPTLKAVKQLTSLSGPGPFNESMFLQVYNCLMDRFVKKKFDQVFSDTTQLFGKMDFWSFFCTCSLFSEKESVRIFLLLPTEGLVWATTAEQKRQERCCWIISELVKLFF